VAFCQTIATKEELSFTYDMLKLRSRALEAQLGASFNIGDVVAFRGRRSQGMVTGTVVGLGARIKVRADSYSFFGKPGPNEVWRVPPSLLSPAKT
jgi:hypothetical protein